MPGDLHLMVHIELRRTNNALWMCVSSIFLAKDVEFIFDPHYRLDNALLLSTAPKNHP
jgi:hypothetical protein